MVHRELEVMRRILGGEGAPQEVETVAEHTLACDRCLALARSVSDELRAQGRELRGVGPLQLLFDLIDRERRWGVASLEAFTEWTEVRRIPNRRTQRDRVRLSKACHTIAFLNLVLCDLKAESSWDEAEFLAGLALLSIEGMSRRQQISQAFGHDLQAEVWTVVANARRRAAEWKRAHQALAGAERHLKEGTGDLRLEANLLSITASILAEEGLTSQALAALDSCKAIYEGLSDWAQLARTLVQRVNVLVEVEPASALGVLERATPLLPAEDAELTILAELLRVKCLIGLKRPTEAVEVYRRCFQLFMVSPKIRLRIRGGFTGAQLLDALGSDQQADRLFYEMVASDIEHELYKDAFLDLLYLYERHAKAGDLDKAALVCRRALTDASLAAVAHDQLRTLWEELLETTTRHQAVSQDLLRELRQYLGAHWKHPADQPPRVAFR